MAITLYGMSDDDTLDVLELWEHKRLQLTHEFDTIHATFDQIIAIHMPDVQDWVSTAIIGELMAHTLDTEAIPLTYVVLPGFWNQVPLDTAINIPHWQDDSDLKVPIYPAVNTQHENLNHALLSTRNQIIAHAQAIDHAANAGIRIAKRLSAATGLVGTLKATLVQVEA